MDQRERFECVAPIVDKWMRDSNVTFTGGGYMSAIELAACVHQAAEAAALERAIDKLLDMANEESTIEYKWAADAIRKLAAPVERGDKS
jgi:hypothetical protein